MVQHRKLLNFKFKKNIADRRLSSALFLNIISNNFFRMFKRSMDNSKPIILMTKSSVELDLWLRALLTSLDYLYPSENSDSNHDLVLLNLPGATCSECNNKFLGIIGQGYQCRECHAIMHKQCLAKRACIDKAVEMRDVMSDSPMKRSGSIALPVFFDR